MDPFQEVGSRRLGLGLVFLGVEDSSTSSHRRAKEGLGSGHMAEDGWAVSRQPGQPQGLKAGPHPSSKSRACRGGMQGREQGDTAEFKPLWIGAKFDLI